MPTLAGEVPDLGTPATAVPLATPPIDSGSSRGAANAPPSTSQPGANVRGLTREVPVVYEGQALFSLRSGLGPLSPRQRAANALERVQALSEAAPEQLDQIRIVRRTNITDVMAGESLIVSVTDADAGPTGRTRDQLAADFTQRLRHALEANHRDRSFVGVLFGLLWTALTLALGALAHFGMRQVKERAITRVRAWQGARIKDVKIQGVELVTAEQVTAQLVRALRGLYGLALVVLAVAVVHAVLSFFPWTRGFAVRGLAHILGALESVGLSVVSYLPNVVYILIIVWVTRNVLRLSDIAFKAIERGALRIEHFRRDWAQPTYKITRFFIVAVSAVLVFPYLPGSSSPAFQGVSIFLGVLLSLGSTSAVANIVAGVVLTYMSPFKAGDRVRIADTTGDVVAANLLVVRVRTPKNEEITVPNAAVLNSHIINYSAMAKSGGFVLHTTVTIGYDVPWERVHELLITAASQVDGVLAKPAPFVLQTSLGDFSVAYELNAHTNRPNRMAQLYSDLHRQIQEAFANANIEIVSPHYVAARDGNPSTVPSAPPFADPTPGSGEPRAPLQRPGLLPGGALSAAAGSMTRKA